MDKLTRNRYDEYIIALARLNGVAPETISKGFTVEPSVQQTLESKVQESSEFLQRINIAGVDEMEGERLGLGVSGPVASTTDTTQKDRQTRDISTLDQFRYRCEKINYDTHITYARLDAWAKFQDFQLRIRDQIIQRIALDRIMIGFNGVTRAATSNLAQNPLLQDVGVGWLQHIRNHAPNRWLKEGKKDSGKVTIGTNGDYKTMDALVMDVVNGMIDPWFRQDTQLVAITGSDLMFDKLFPLVNSIQPPTEQKTSQDLITAPKRLGNRQAELVPFFPPNSILITRLDNLSIYYQISAQRRSVVERPERDRIDTYQSSNDAYVVEDFGCAALIENIELLT